MTRHLVVDTSLFVNPASAQAYGSNPTAAFTRFLEKLSISTDVLVYMPPSVYYELMHFAEEKMISPSLLSLIRQVAPKKHELKVPGFFIYQLVESYRDRVDRGLRLAERHVREALQSPVAPPGANAASANMIRPDAKLISNLRESFRRMMREGTLDSKADVDLLLLAYEIPAVLVSADEGVNAWAENLGIEILPYNQLPALLENNAAKNPQ